MLSGELALLSVELAMPQCNIDGALWKLPLRGWEVDGRECKLDEQDCKLDASFCDLDALFCRIERRFSRESEWFRMVAVAVGDFAA